MPEMATIPEVSQGLQDAKVGSIEGKKKEPSAASYLFFLGMTAPKQALAENNELMSLQRFNAKSYDTCLLWYPASMHAFMSRFLRT